MHLEALTLPVLETLKAGRAKYALAILLRDAGGLADYVIGWLLKSMHMRSHLSVVRHPVAIEWRIAVAGFDVADAIALLRLDDLYVEVFEVKDVKVQLLPRCLPALVCVFNLSLLPVKDSFAHCVLN